MNIWKYYDITCRDHIVLNPMSVEKHDEVIQLLKLPRQARVLDIACGKGEALIRVAEQHHIQGVGIDISPFFAAAAKERAAQREISPSCLEFLEMDGAKYVDAEPFELAMCIGASWVYGGHRGTLRHLAKFVRPGGLILVGEPYWRKTPDPAYLEATGEKPENYATYAGNVEAGVEEGLIPLYSVASSEDDWDRYEWLRVQAAERYAQANPHDADVPELLQRARRTRDAYVRWGRDSLGWGLFLFLKP